MTPLTSTGCTACNCADSPPQWFLTLAKCNGIGCPAPQIGTYKSATQSYSINYTPGNNYYTITVYYTRCNQFQGNYTASATSSHYSNNGDYEIKTNYIINQKISCTQGACPPTCTNLVS